MRPTGDFAAVPQSIRGATISARVPGCVHTDLMRAGLIPDPRVGTNELDLLWIGETDWEYRTTFDLSPEQLAHDRLDLACDGLDTIAELSLNGRPIGAAANMFHPHRFDLRGAARAGPNDLSITFRSPLKHIRAEEKRLGARPVNGDWDPYIFIRKTACNFGWDWAPKVATCGIWKPISIEAWSGVRVAAARPLVRRESGEKWVTDVRVDLEWSGIGEEAGASLEVRLSGHGVDVPTAGWIPAGQLSAMLSVVIEHPGMWWPRGSGEQPLYDLAVGLAVRPEGARPLPGASASLAPGRQAPPPSSCSSSPGGCTTTGVPNLTRPPGEEIDIEREVGGASQGRRSVAPGNHRAPEAGEGASEEREGRSGLGVVGHRWSGQIAFREVKLNTDADVHGHKFQLEINGKSIFCKGANWIPEGLFPDDRSSEIIHQRIQQAAAANMNMLRVWGGGFYESDEFYDECDRLGIMVWQDFMFACACYPEEPPFPQLIEAEARHQITRLSAHPSVVLWCGGNESVWGYESWGDEQPADKQPDRQGGLSAAPKRITWKDRVGDKSWGRGYYFDLLPRLLRELDPTRPYWPNSPFRGTGVPPVVLPAHAFAATWNPNDPNSGDRHTWDAIATTPAFRALIPRFCSEFGHQSPPNIPTLAKVVRPEDLTINSPALHHRQRATGGMARHIDEPMATEFQPPKDFVAWHANAQQMQARALKHGLEWLLSNQPCCMGALIWQFNDCWPGMSWSLIDSDGMPKPAYYAVQEAFGRFTP
jgi:beta-mannosidase